MKMLTRASLMLACFSLFFLNQAHAQDTLSSDELFLAARKAAFDKKNYPLAIHLSKEALKKAPDYSDIRIFIGRVYTWTDKLDSARAAFNYVLSRHPDNEDAASAFTDLEYWNDQYEKALKYCNQGLRYHPHSEKLMLKKAKVLNSMGRYEKAYTIADTLLEINPKNNQARSLAGTIKSNSSLNEVGISYDFVYFDKQFSDPWHLLSLSYSRPTKLGSVIGKINYANRFAENGLQGEIVFYPHISQTFYAYLEVGISGTNSVFPQYRAGASLYANLPWSLEADVGFRYLRFSSDVWIYTASLGKYYKNFWFNLRTYIVPDNEDISQSYTLSVRYYTGGADDYFSFIAGTGISPDDPAKTALLGTDSKLKAKKLGAGYSHVFKKLNTFKLGITWYRQEYKTDTYGNQWDFGISYQRRF